MAQAGYEILLNFIFSKKSHKYNKFLSKSYYECLFPFVFNIPVQNDIVYWYCTQKFQREKKPIQL